MLVGSEAPWTRRLAALVTCVLFVLFAAGGAASASRRCPFSLAMVNKLMQENFTALSDSSYPGARVCYLMKGSVSGGVLEVVQHGASTYAQEERVARAQIPHFGSRIRPLPALGSHAYWFWFTTGGDTQQDLAVLFGSEYVVVQTIGHPRPLNDLENVARYLASA